MRQDDLIKKNDSIKKVQIQAKKQPAEDKYPTFFGRLSFIQQFSRTSTDLLLTGRKLQWWQLLFWCRSNSKGRRWWQSILLFGIMVVFSYPLPEGKIRTMQRKLPKALSLSKIIYNPYIIFFWFNFSSFCYFLLCFIGKAERFQHWNISLNVKPKTTSKP